MSDYNTNSRYWYGLRHGSDQPKALGFFGELPVRGGVATEYSADVDIDGKNVQIPTITPNLNGNELARLLRAISSDAQVPDDLMQKATQNARVRMLLGKSPFWAMPEKQYKPGGLLGEPPTPDNALYRLLYGNGVPIK